jgi:1,2-phenylacetyl-CoA epoxidase PaaB subunit
VWQVFDKATAELRVEHKHLYSLYCCRRERHLKMEREVECGKEGLKLELK